MEKQVFRNKNVTQIMAYILAAMLMACIAWTGIIGIRNGAVVQILLERTAKEESGDWCEAIFADGRVTNNGDWQPYGCSMHSYTSSKVQQCLQIRKGHNNASTAVHFYGDSKVRDQYFSLLELMAGVTSSDRFQENIQYTDEEGLLTLNFYWTIAIDTELFRILEEVLFTSRDERPPDLIVNGAALWPLKNHNGSLRAVEDITDGLIALRPLLKQLTRISSVVWMLQEPLNASMLKEERRIWFENYDIPGNLKLQTINNITDAILKTTNVTVWKSLLKVYASSDNPTWDGMHLNAPVLHQDSQMLVNYLCNAHMSFPDATCCT